DRVHERLGDDVVCGHVVVFGLEGEMFFGSVVSLEAHLETIESRIGPETRIVVMRMKRARNPDAAGMAVFETFVDRVQARGVTVLLCGVRPALHEVLVKSGLTERLIEKKIFLEQPVRQTSTLFAVQHAASLLESPCPHCPRPADAA
ncbi:MAG: sodium-independent anion transporter, partial [Candidatus Binatia bacterium]